MSKDSIFTKIPEFAAQTPPPATDPEAFGKVVSSRRSVRVFSDDKIPDEVVSRVLEWGLLAPNSSNLQTWQFYRIKSPATRTKIVKACFSQNAASTASELIVCVASPSLFKKHSVQMMQAFGDHYKGDVPSVISDYYTKIAPFLYSQGPLGMFGLLKRIGFFLLGFFRPVPRGPFSHAQMKEWAAKSSALACQNIMLGFRAYGFDSCPMEGFDEVLVRKAIGYTKDAFTVMIIGAGKRAENGVYGPQLRFPKEQFIFTI